MKAKKQLKLLKKFIHDEVIQAKANLYNSVSPHNSIKEEAIAKTKYETLKSIAYKLIQLRNK